MAADAGACGHPSRRRASARLLRMTAECTAPKVLRVRFGSQSKTIINHILKAQLYKPWALSATIEVMNVQRRPDLRPQFADHRIAAGNRSAGAVEGGTAASGRGGELERAGKPAQFGDHVQSKVVVDLHERRRQRRQSAGRRNPAEHRQYWRLRDEADRGDPDQSGARKAEVADRHQLQSRRGSLRPRL